MSPTLLDCHRDQSSFLPWFVRNLSLQQEKPGSHHLPIFYLIVQIQYTRIVFSGMFTHAPVGNNLAENSDDAQFRLPLVLGTPLISEVT